MFFTKTLKVKTTNVDLGPRGAREERHVYETTGSTDGFVQARPGGEDHGIAGCRLDRSFFFACGHGVCNAGERARSGANRPGEVGGACREHALAFRAERGSGERAGSALFCPGA